MKPDIPQTLAAKIRGAQFRVDAACQSLAGTDYTIRQEQKRVDEFDRDPEAFARTHYPQCAEGVNSYPVQTTIARSREKLANKLSYRARDEQRILEAIEALRVVEDDILRQVENINASAGRVPWPKPIPSTESTIGKWNSDMAAVIEQARIDREENMAEFRKMQEEEEAALLAQRDIDDAEMLADMEKMTPERRAAFMKSMQDIADDLKNGVVGFSDFGDYIKNRKYQR